MTAKHGTVESCTCSGCQGACRYCPGWFLPGEAEKLAAAMHLTLRELFAEHLVVKWWSGGDAKTPELVDDVFVLSPRVVGADGGEMAPADPRGTCAWFKGGRCEVHALGKPHECAASLPHDDADNFSNRHAAVARAWSKPEHQKQIRDLLGREPESESMFAALSL